MIIKNDEKKLREKSESCSLKEGQNILNQLREELEKNNREEKIRGLGLSGCQIGIFKRVIYFIFKNDTLALINPVITDKEEEIIFKNEGCLSFPDKWITTKRYNKITVKDDLHEGGIVLEGIEAIAVQHEADHLDGILFFDRGYTGIRVESKPGRNESCSCGSGKKYKKCCGK